VACGATAKGMRACRRAQSRSAHGISSRKRQKEEGALLSDGSGCFEVLSNLEQSKATLPGRTGHKAANGAEHSDAPLLVDDQEHI
jgi:hypothetical protein